MYTKTVGKGTKAYKLKDWIIYRGKGKERVSSAFMRILTNSDKPHKLTKK